MAAAPPALRRLSPAPTALSPAIWAAACAGDVAQVAALYEAEGYTHIDARSTYQSTLLHAAARHGHVRLAADLLAKRADVNAIDFGGMRRQPLHWACRSGSVEMVELLVAAGADTKAHGRSWSKLVQGSRCGSLIPKDSPTESTESLCLNNAVRLALTQPAWEPELHHLWPPRFRAAVRLLLLAACGGGGGGDGLPISRDALLEVLRRSAYPISAWM